MAYKIAKENKPFAHSEFIKDCMVEAVGVVSAKAKLKVEACQEELLFNALAQLQTIVDIKWSF